MPVEPTHHSFDSAEPVKETTTRLCPYCHQPTEIKIGLRNWRNLFRWPTIEDFITLFIISLVIFSAYAYQWDTQAMRTTIENMTNICTQYCHGEMTFNHTSSLYPSLNMTIIKNAFTCSGGNITNASC